MLATDSGGTLAESGNAGPGHMPKDFPISFPTDCIHFFSAVVQGPTLATSPRPWTTGTRRSSQASLRNRRGAMTLKFFPLWVLA